MGAQVDLHQVVFEELLQLPLGGRIREVPNIESPTLSRTGNDSLVLSCIDGLVASSANVGAFGCAGGLVEGGVCHLGGNAIDRSGHDYLSFVNLMTRGCCFDNKVLLK